jgi:hypothetical protein
MNDRDYHLPTDWIKRNESQISCIVNTKPFSDKVSMYCIAERPSVDNLMKEGPNEQPLWFTEFIVVFGVLK